MYLNTRAALNMGYKLIDTAVMYGNEEEIGSFAGSIQIVSLYLEQLGRFIN